MLTTLFWTKLFKGSHSLPGILRRKLNKIHILYKSSHVKLIVGLWRGTWELALQCFELTLPFRLYLYRWISNYVNTITRVTLSNWKKTKKMIRTEQINTRQKHEVSFWIEWARILFYVKHVSATLITNERGLSRIKEDILYNLNKSFYPHCF